MKKLFQVISFMVVLLLLLLILVIIFNPLELRTKMVSAAINAFFGSSFESVETLPGDEVGEGKENLATSSAATKESDGHPFLNDEQEAALENFGVDVDKLPTELSPSMEACLLEKLGSERAQEIISGDTPSAMEILKAGTCLGD